MVTKQLTKKSFYGCNFLYFLHNVQRDSPIVLFFIGGKTNVIITHQDIIYLTPAGFSHNHCKEVIKKVIISTEQPSGFVL